MCATSYPYGRVSGPEALSTGPEQSAEAICCSQRCKCSESASLSFNRACLISAPTVMLQAPAKAQPKAAVNDAHKRFANADKISIKAQLVFEACWRKLEKKWGGVS